MLNVLVFARHTTLVPAFKSVFLAGMETKSRIPYKVLGAVLFSLTYNGVTYL